MIKILKNEKSKHIVFLFLVSNMEISITLPKSFILE
jgi:hypothetical protein